MKSILAIPIFCSILAFSNCSSHQRNHDHDHDHDLAESHKHEHEHEHEHSEAIVIEPDDAKLLGIECDTARITDFSEVIDLSGKIEPAADDQVNIVAPTSGIVSLVKLTVGNTVGKGQTIAKIESSGISGGNQNAAQRAALISAKKELERLEPLKKEGIVTNKEYNDAVAAYEIAKASYSPKAASGLVTSPQNGVLNAINITNGDFVNSGDIIAVVGGNNSLNLRIDLPEKYRSTINDINDVLFKPSYSKDWISVKESEGKIITSSSMPTGLSGYVPVYATLKNVGQLSSGSIVEAKIKVGRTDKCIALPKEAVIEQLGVYFVFLKTGDHEYKKQKVEIGKSDGIYVPILSGVNNNDVVVVKGAVMVKLSENKGAVPEGHTHNH